MSEEKTKAIQHAGNFSTVAQVKREYAMVDRLVKDVMEEEIIENGKVVKKGDYGKIPGCGNDLILRKAGAQKICRLFKVRPVYRLILREDLGDGHIGFEYECDLVGIGSDIIVSTGGGYCSTKETKYAFRSGFENIGEPVPKWYWNEKKQNFKAASQKIKDEFGEDCYVKKIDDEWCIAKKIQEANPNIHDVINTAKKQSMKRAYVEATVTMSACSNIFTQDLEFTEEDYEEAEGQKIKNNNTKIPPPEFENIGNNEKKPDNVSKADVDKFFALVVKYTGSEPDASIWLEEQTTELFKNGTLRPITDPDDIKSPVLLKDLYERLETLRSA